MISRTVLAFVVPTSFSGKASTFGGGAAGGVPRDVLEDERAAQHRRRPVRIRRSHQDGTFAEQPPTRGVRELDAPEAVAFDVSDAVQGRHPLVHDTYGLPSEIDHAAIFVEDAVYE